MKYVALLRGINVGGNTLIKMSELKLMFENLGFENIVTYINSGNIIFESDHKELEITEKIEKGIKKEFRLDVKVVIRSKNEIQKIVDEVPYEWNKSKNIRCYVGFTRDSITPHDVVREVKLKEGVDNIATGKHVVYMTTLPSGLTKSGFTRLATSKIYKEITIRNYNTVKKILELMNA